MRQKLFFLSTILFTLNFGLLGQINNIVSYDFRSGTIIAAGVSPDSVITLVGNYSLHGAQYGLNMKVNGEIKVKVNGSCTVRFLGSAYSKLKMQGTAMTEGDLGVLNTQVSNDLADKYAFTYSGKAATLTFKLVPGNGNDLYLPSMEIIPAQKGKDFTLPEKNIVYYFDLRDGSIIPTATTGQTNLSVGLMDVIVGSSNAYGYNGAQHGSILKGGNQIKLKLAGNSKIKIGGSIYSNGTIKPSSTKGNFNVASQPAVTSGNFGNDGSTVDFIYVGDSTIVALDFTGTNYIPYIEILPITYEITLTSYVQKSGKINLNNTEISLTTGADANANATVTLSKGTVISATNQVASIFIDLGGKALSNYTPTYSGAIDTVIISKDTLSIKFSDPSTDPKSYIFKVSDSSKKVTAQAGKTYTYNFTNGSELPQTGYQSLRYATYISKDGILTVNSNTSIAAGQFGYHDSSHGGVFFPGNSFSMIVAGNAIITFIVDTYGVAADAVFEMKDEQGNILGTITAVNLGKEDGFPVNFAYNGKTGIVTATIKSTNFPTAEIYLHGMNIENGPEVVPSSGKIDVWDFGAQQLDSTKYNNVLNENIINSWYAPTVAVGSSGNVLPASFTAGALIWTGGSNDRLRTTNQKLTRYDENIAGATAYTGRLYVNSGAAVSRFLSLQLNADDEVTIATKTDSGGEINFQFVADPSIQTNVVPVTSDFVELKFTAKESGSYRIFDTKGKPSYFRIYRSEAKYINLTGKIDKIAASEISSNYKIIFTNEAGKSWKVQPADTTYSAALPSNHTYSLALEGANGFVISGGKSLTLTDSTLVHNITISKVELYAVSGKILGLGSKINNLVLNYSTTDPAGAIYVPAPVIDKVGKTYSVKLQPSKPYTISAVGVNDFIVENQTIKIPNADTTADIIFVGKATFKVTLTTQGLDEVAMAKLKVNFTNFTETGYTYSFADLNSIFLRNGTYTVSTGGLDSFPVELALTSNLKINNAVASKVLNFRAVHNWSFNDKVIANGDPAYKGMLFSGNVSNEILKGHLTAKQDAEIKIPVNPGERVIVQYYYTADFTLDGQYKTVTNTQSTSQLESVSYDYMSTSKGFVTIKVGPSAATTYITDITTVAILPYTPIITVGLNKDYQTINGALDAVRRMTRTIDQRVTIAIDPNNYEEMLVIDMNNVTLKNASPSPSIALTNSGLNIHPNAVRVTSYYGYGYNYYSMNNQRWNSEVLQVNKENGFYSYENKSGTTNGSYWNATVVVYGSGFIARDIIFENSYNQYISKKESEDIVKEWEVGGKGTRPVAVGNTTVQDRSFRERAAAIAFANNTDKAILYKCKVVGRQDALFGGVGARVVMYKGSAMGAVDYIFGGMDAVFYKTQLALNSSDTGSDAAYITAAQQSSGRGYLMYECTVTSAIPGAETVSKTRAIPGYFGRPWQATTSEVVFYNTTIETTDFPGKEGKSLIDPEGWKNTLGGESKMMYEFGTRELSGENNSGARASWSTILTTPKLTDGTDITTFNFTKGSDGWDPIPELIAGDVASAVHNTLPQSSVRVFSDGHEIYFTNVRSETIIFEYDLQGCLNRTYTIYNDTQIMPEKSGIHIIYLKATDGIKSVKVFTD